MCPNFTPRSTASIPLGEKSMPEKVDALSCFQVSGVQWSTTFRETCKRRAGTKNLQIFSSAARVLICGQCSALHPLAGCISDIVRGEAQRDAASYLIFNLKGHGRNQFPNQTSDTLAIVVRAFSAPATPWASRARSSRFYVRFSDAVLLAESPRTPREFSTDKFDC